MSEQPLEQRGTNRSVKPKSDAFRQFIAGQWAEPPAGSTEPLPSSGPGARRRAALGAEFPGERLVIPAGAYKIRNNDCEYRFRPNSAFAHLTGLGTDQQPDAVLVLHPLTPRPGDAAPDGDVPARGDAPASSTPPAEPTHEAVLYLNPPAGKDSPEFYSDPAYGEFWVGRRPRIEEIAAQTGIRTEPLSSLRDALAKDAGPGHVQLRVIRNADQNVTALVDGVRREAGLPIPGPDSEHISTDDQLLEAASELRLVKDDYEIGEMRAAIAASIRGFERVVRAIPEARAAERGERVIEAAFQYGARIDGNGLGYETIAAAGDHATTLHWIDNTGPVRDGDLLLLDAGVEVESLYTADLTRTIPVSGRYSDMQRRVWEAVVDSADAAFAAAHVGNRFVDVHEAALRRLAEHLADWGLLPVSVEEAMSPEGQQHRRWMVHGTSHHLGIDVHDCAQARAEMYTYAEIRPGMVFTIEPGLYFKNEDLAVPPEYRGIGCRCEDDIWISPDGPVRLSEALPRHADQIERWMAGLLG